jgi:hypothetical protein
MHGTGQGGRGREGGRAGAPPLAPLQRLAALAGGFAIAGAFYLVLIDTLDLPELYAGAGATLLAALAFEAAREQGFVEAGLRPQWLLGIWRLALQIPADIVRVAFAAVSQAVTLRPRRGVLRAVPFDPGDRDSSRAAGRRALAEAAGSLPPNTIVIGVDVDRGLLLAHQLVRTGEAEQIDTLRLG